MRFAKYNNRLCRAIVAVMVGLVVILSILPLSITHVKAVSTEADLLAAVSADQAVELTADITLTSWTAQDYSGEFNGNGHILSGLTTPLFNTLSGTVTDLGVVAAVSSFDAPAVLAATVSGQSASVTNCFSYGTIAYTGTDTVGGLIATLENGSVSNCFSAVTIETQTAAYVGGLIGTISGGTVEHCYSSGAILARSGIVAGFANQIGGTVSDTYTSCQLVYTNSYAKPSGVNGLYDNQLSIMRESLENNGVTTKDLLTASELLSDQFAVTTTAYPALTVFYGDQWGRNAKNIVEVSIAAAIFSDVDPTLRNEPAGFAARADYLTYSTYIDRTNTEDLSWNLNCATCKLYDTVPLTSASQAGAITSGSSADLLRAELVFSENAAFVPLTASDGTYIRTWYISAYAANPYFANGDGAPTTPYEIASREQLDHVRYYSLITDLTYSVTADIASCSDFDPIDHFGGVFLGNHHTISEVSIVDDGENAFGLFGSTQNGASISDLRLVNVSFTANDQHLATVGALIGDAAANTTVSEVVVAGTNTVLTTNGIGGGLIGKATQTVVSKALVSVQLQAGANGGGLIGSMMGGTLTESGVTGYVAGATQLGGLVGYADGAASINHSYSTAAVISSASETAYVGGLVGNAMAATITSSYAAAFVDAPAATAGVSAIVGDGSLADGCYYDETVSYTQSTSGTPTPTSAMLGADALPSLTDVWTKTADHYPQLTYFVSASAELSALSTQPVYFQQYWLEASSEDMTTGWIAKNFSATNAFSQPTALNAFSQDAIQAYTVSAKDVFPEGWGFEPQNRQRRTVVQIASADLTIGVRVVGAVRNDLFTLSYDILGIDDVNTCLEIYYSLDDQTWSGSQIMTSSSAVKDPVLYNIPAGSYLKFRILTDDDYAVDYITVNGQMLSFGDDGFYTTAVTYSADTKAVIVIKVGAPPWGIRKESY